MCMNVYTEAFMAVEEQHFTKDNAKDFENYLKEIKMRRHLTHGNVVQYYGTEISPGIQLNIFKGTQLYSPQAYHQT